MARCLVGVRHQITVQTLVGKSTWPNQQPIPAPAAVHRQQKQRQFSSLLRRLLQQSAPRHRWWSSGGHPLQNHIWWTVSNFVQAIRRCRYSQAVYPTREWMERAWGDSNESRKHRARWLGHKRWSPGIWCEWCFSVVYSQEFRGEQYFRESYRSKEMGGAIWEGGEESESEAWWSRERRECLS